MSGAIAYAMSDYAPSRDGQVGPGSVSLPADRGGCGKQHVAKIDDGNHPYIECEQCGPVLIASHAAFAGTPGGVPLTPDELGERELAERDAKATERVILRSVTDHLVEQITANKQVKAEAPSLMEQISALSAKDRAQLAKVLAGEPLEEPDENPKDEAKGPVQPKRGPGRPRTAR
jgi:hypothetical protein